MFPIFPDASPGFWWMEFYFQYYLNVIKRTLHKILWHPWDLSRLTVRIELVSRCRITAVSDWAFFYVIKSSNLFLVQIFENKTLCFAINSINKRFEMTVIAKRRNNNSSKKSSFILILFIVNTYNITHKSRSWGVFFNVCMLFIVRLNLYIL